MTFGIVLTLRTIMELWQMKGAYSVEGVMEVMVGGLEEEVRERVKNGRAEALSCVPLTRCCAPSLSPQLGERMKGQMRPVMGPDDGSEGF